MTTLVRAGLLACMMFGLAAHTVAQDSPATDDPLTETQPAASINRPPASDSAETPTAVAPRRMTPPAGSAAWDVPRTPPSAYAPFRVLIPDFSGTTIKWIAVVLILALLLQTRPLLSWLNLDALMLALAAVALAFRSETAPCPADGPTLQFWSYAILTGVCVYWLWRGLQLTIWRALPTRSANVSEGAMLVLIVAALAIGFNAIVNAPLGEGTRDGMAGGIYMAETGMLPYGDLPGRDVRSPLVYAVHAGAVKVVPPTDGSGPLAWESRSEWLEGPRLEALDPPAPRLVNGLLFVLLLAGVGLTGQRLHSVAMGWTLVVLLAIFPGTLESLADTDVLLPAALMAWAVAFLTMPAVGPFLATLLLVLAGLAWPWAWLALPVVLVYFIRRGWQALAVVGAMLVGATAIGALLLFHVKPTLPRADGALAAAGNKPGYSVALGPNDALVIEEYKPDTVPVGDFKSQLWKWLLEVESTSVGAGYDLPPGTSAGNVLYRNLTATSAARERVQASYRKAVAAWPDSTRLVVALRSVLESVWRPDVVRAPILPTPWSVWLGDSPEAESSRVLAQRIVKGVLAALVLFLCWRMTRFAQPALHHLLGALLVIAAGAMLASEQGATANWAWLLPLALTVLAAPVDGSADPRLLATPRASPPPQPTRPSNPSMFASRTAEPRISVER